MAPSAQNEQLGIELVLTLDSKFGDLVKKIETAFKNVDLKGFEQKVAGVESKVSKLAEEIQKVVGGSASKIQLDIDTSNLNKKMADATKVINDYKNVTVTATGQIVSSLKEAERVQNEVNKAYAQRTSQNNAADKIARQSAAAYQKEEAAAGRKMNLLNTLQRKEEAISAAKESRDAKELQSTLRKIDQENAAYDRQQQTSLRALARYQEQEYNSKQRLYEKMFNQADRRDATEARQQQTSLRTLARFQEQQYNEKQKMYDKLFSYDNIGSQFMAGIGKQGKKIFNGDIIPKTYVTDIAKAREQADRFTESLRKQEAQLAILNGTASAWSPAISKRMQGTTGLAGGDNWSKDIGIQAKQAEKFLQSLGKQGFEYVNGQIKKINVESKNFLTSLGSLIGLEAKFYGIRSVLFGITGQFKTAVSSIIAYKQTVSEIGAITTATDSEMKEYEKTISLLARSSKYAATDIASAMKVVAQSGIQRNELIPVTRAAELLAASTGGSPEAAANVVTTTMNVWQVAADKAIGLTNTMATAMKNSKLNVNDLAESFNYVASSAHAANMSVDETLSTIAAMRNKGVVASTVGTGLRQFLKVLEAPTAKVKQLFKDLEMGPDQVDPKLRSLGDILNDISERGIKKFGSEMALSNRLSEAFEMRTGNAAKVLISSGNAINSMTFAMKNSVAGFLALERSMEGPQVKINKIQHEFMLFVQLLGEDFMTAITAGTGGLLDFVKGLQDTEVRANVMIDVIGAVALAVVTAITAIAGSIKTLYLSNPWLLALTAAFTAYSAVVLATAGNLKYINEEQEKHLKSIKNEADENQRRTNELNKFIGTLDKVNGHNRTLNELTADQKKHLDALKPSMKGMLDQLDGEKSLIEQLIPLMKEFAVQRGKILIDSAKFSNSMKISQKQLRDEADTLESNAGGGAIAWGLLKTAEMEAKFRSADDPWRISRHFMEKYGADSPANATGFLPPSAQTAWMKARARDLRNQAASMDSKIAGMDVMTGGLPKVKTRDGLDLVDIKLAEAATANVDDAEEKRRKAAEEGYNGRSKFGGNTTAEGVQVLNADIEAKKIEIKDLNNEIKALKIILEDSLTAPDQLDSTKSKIIDKLKSIQRLEKEVADAQEDKSVLKGQAGNIAKVRSNKANEIDSAYTTEVAEIEKILKHTQKAQAMAKHMATDAELKDEEEANKKSLPALEKIMKDRNKDVVERRKAYDDALLIEMEIIENDYKRKIHAIHMDAEKLVEGDRKDHIDKRTSSADAEKQAAIKAAQDKYSGYFDHKMNPMAEEKMAEHLLANKQATVKLLKDQAWTQKEVNALEVQGLENQKEHLEKIAEIYGMVEKGSDGYNDAQEKIAAVRLELAALNKEIEKHKDQSFIGNLRNGAKRGAIGLGDFKSNTEQLGQDVTSTIGNGMVNLLDESIQKLAKLEWSWKSFKQALGNILGDIAKMLTQYIAKMMVVWAVEKLIGLAGAAAGTSISEVGTGGLDLENSAFANTGGLIGSNGSVFHFADGGQVPLSMGTPGKDSVRAWLTPGEIVIKESAVKKYGADTFLKYNAMKFANGGLVGAGSSSSNNSNSEEGAKILQIVNVVDSASIPKTTDAQIINVINYEIAKRGSTLQTIKMALS